MEILLTEEQNITVATLAGDIDGRTAPEAQAKIGPKITEGVRLMLDLSGVPYMSSAGLRMLLLVYRQIAAKKGCVVLVGLNDEISDTMEATGFLEHFKTFATAEEGMAELENCNS
jgi:anti-sigma B factor antagonist